VEAAGNLAEMMIVGSVGIVLALWKYNDWHSVPFDHI